MSSENVLYLSPLRAQIANRLINHGMTPEKMTVESVHDLFKKHNAANKLMEDIGESNLLKVFSKWFVAESLINENRTFRKMNNLRELGRNHSPMGEAFDCRLSDAIIQLAQEQNRPISLEQFADLCQDTAVKTHTEAILNSKKPNKPNKNSSSSTVSYSTDFIFEHVKRSDDIRKVYDSIVPFRRIKDGENREIEDALEARVVAAEKAKTRDAAAKQAEETMMKIKAETAPDKQKKVVSTNRRNKPQMSTSSCTKRESRA